MENYFQAEAFNLDKVLDEFEQNEGEPRRWGPGGRSPGASASGGILGGRGGQILGVLRQMEPGLIEGVPSGNNAN